MIALIVIGLLLVLVGGGVAIWYFAVKVPASNDEAAAASAAASLEADTAAAEAAKAAAAAAAKAAASKDAADAAAAAEAALAAEAAAKAADVAAAAAALAAAKAAAFDCTKLTQSAVDFYNTKGEWKGQYTMNPILSNKFSDNTCDISYRYTPVGQTNAVGGDRRRFTYAWDGTKWDVSAMSAYNSGTTVSMPRLYKFYQGKDSKGNDITPPSPYTYSTISDLLQKCNNTPNCIATNTNGWIKKAINSSLATEVSFTGANQGVYVLDSFDGTFGTPTSTRVERFGGARNFERFVNW